ncbi:MAG TPA: hypothetical protein VE620_02140 [Myxococcales bacterium]|jgi:hypothetical protein|nr:hypothetical protein [Myxococcales bacterium]
MLRANHAVRLGLRASTRNPELSFGKALLDAVGTALSLLPWLMALVALAAAAGRFEALEAVVAFAVALGRMRWAAVGMALTAMALTWTLSMAFWAGALPVLAADAELQRRPPPGHFWPLAIRGFARVVSAGAVAYGLAILFAAALLAGSVSAAIALVMHPTVARFAVLALLASLGIVCGILIDLLARLMLIRAAAFGDGASSAFARAADLLARRLGACLVVQVAFAFLELVVASAAGLFSGVVLGDFDPAVQLLAVPLRIAVWLAFAAVFAWLEVARQGALAALAADAEGLIELPPEPPPPAPVPAVLQRPDVIEGVPVIEGIPVPPGTKPDEK